MPTVWTPWKIIITQVENIYSNIVFNDTDWTHTYEYLRLYMHVHDSMIMVREEIFNLADTSRWMKFCDSSQRLGSNYNAPHICPVVERYFEKPVTVYDSLTDARRVCGKRCLFSLVSLSL